MTQIQTGKYPAIYNLAASLSLRIIGILFSFLVVGQASRQLSQSDLEFVIQGFNFFAMFGLVQAGLGTTVLLAIVRSHASGQRLQDVAEIAPAFRTVSAMSFGACVLFYLLMPTVAYDALMPAALVILLGVPCGIADQVRVGTERGWTLNICLLIVYLGLGIVFALLQMFKCLSTPVVVLICYSPAAITSIVSFCSLLPSGEFRQALMRSPPGIYGILLRKSFPIFMASLSSSLLVFLPTAGKWVPWLPAMTYDEAILARLCILFANATVSLMTPLMPTLLRRLYAMSPRIRQRYIRAGFAVILLGLFFCFEFSTYVLPVVAKYWVGANIQDHQTIVRWSLVFTLWIGAALSGQFVLMTARTANVFAVVITCDALIFAAMCASKWTGYGGVAEAMAIGLAWHIVGACALAFSTTFEAVFPASSERSGRKAEVSVPIT